MTDLLDVNTGARDIVAAGRLTDYIATWARRDPDAPALSQGDQTLTYAELDARLEEWASALLGSGVRRGDAVALLSRPTVDAITLFLACASVGLVFQGLNPSYTEHELEYVLRDSQATLVLDTLDGRALAAATAVGGSRPLRWAGEFPLRRKVTPRQLAAARAAVAPGDPVLLVHTSGSTGKPKGALIPTGALAYAADVHSRRWVPRRRGTTICPFPINHVASLSDICGTAFAAGARVVCMPEFDARALVRALENERVTFWGLIPAVGVLTTQTPEWKSADLSHLDLAVWGGGAAPETLLAALRAKGVQVQGCYGSTETVGNVIFSEGDTCDDATLASTIGRPDPAYQVRLVKSDGSPCAFGEAGELLVKNDHGFLGYLGRPAETAATLDEHGWLHTGDLAVQRPDGYFALVGRIHEMFKSGGYNVYPREVELALEGLPGVRQAAVVAVPDDTFGEVGFAVIVGDVIDVEGLRTSLRESLAPYKVPKRVEVWQELPLLPVGKVDKNAVRERLLLAPSDQ